MGHMKTWWLFGFEWWGGLRPAEMTTKKGMRYVPLFWGLWLRQVKKKEKKPRVSTGFVLHRPSPTFSRGSGEKKLHLGFTRKTRQ